MKKDVAELGQVLQPAKAALLVIDVQKDFAKPPMRPAVDALATLLAGARAAGVYVVYVQNVVMAHGLSHTAAETLRRRRLGMALEVTVDGTAGQEFVEEIAPRKSDPVVRKLRLDAFYGTSLETVLRARGIETVLITGIATHGCVTGTSYAAQARDFNVVVVSDCVATWDESLHTAALRVLGGTMTGISTSSELLEHWESPRENQHGALR
jgi:nicotinamidase-related amidase